MLAMLGDRQAGERLVLVTKDSALADFPIRTLW